MTDWMKTALLWAAILTVLAVIFSADVELSTTSKVLMFIAPWMR